MMMITTLKSDKTLLFGNSVSCQILPNPIIDGVAPTSTGGTIETATLCNLMGINMNLIKLKNLYLRGWVPAVSMHV